MLQREPGTALHRQLFLVLREQIHVGHVSTGQPIPTEDELGALYGVSRITVRRAVADLASEGLVEKLPGRGTFVTGGPRSVRGAPSLGLLDSLAQQARDTEVRVLKAGLAKVPDAIAAQLALPAGARAVHASRLRSMARVPVMVTEAWVPEEIGSRVTAARLKKQALFEILLAEGVRFGRVVQEVTATAAEPRLAGLLQVVIGSPLLRIVRLLHDEHEQPVQHLTIHAAAERSRLLMDVSAAAVNSLGAGQLLHEPAAARGKTPATRSVRR